MDDIYPLSLNGVLEYKTKGFALVAIHDGEVIKIKYLYDYLPREDWKYGVAAEEFGFWVDFEVLDMCKHPATLEQMGLMWQYGQLHFGYFEHGLFHSQSRLKYA